MCWTAFQAPAAVIGVLFSTPKKERADQYLTGFPLPVQQHSGSTGQEGAHPHREDEDKAGVGWGGDRVKEGRHPIKLFQSNRPEVPQRGCCGL